MNQLTNNYTEEDVTIMNSQREKRKQALRIKELETENITLIVRLENLEKKYTEIIKQLQTIKGK